MKKLFWSTPLLALPLLVAAQPDRLEDTLPGGASDVVDLIDTLTNWFFTILLVLAVLVIIMAAFRYLTSAGDATKVSGAHKMLIYAVIALVVAFLAKGIVYVVAQLVG